MPANLDQLKNELRACCTRLESIAFANSILTSIENNYNKKFAPLENKDERGQDAQYEFYLAINKLVDTISSSIDRIGQSEIASILMAHRFGMTEVGARIAVQRCIKSTDLLTNETPEERKQRREAIKQQSLEDLKTRISYALLLDGSAKDKVQRIVDCIKATSPVDGPKPQELYVLFFQFLLDNNLVGNKIDEDGRKRIVWGRNHHHAIQEAGSALIEPLDNLSADEFVLKAIIYNCDYTSHSNYSYNLRARDSWSLALYALFEIREGSEMVFFPTESERYEQIRSIIDRENFAEVNPQNASAFHINLLLNVAIVINKSALFSGANLPYHPFQDGEWFDCIFASRIIKGFDPLYTTHPLYVLMKGANFDGIDILTRDQYLPIGRLIVGDLDNSLDFHGYEHLQINELAQEQNRRQLYRIVTSIWGNVDSSKMREVISKIPLYGMSVEQQDYVVIRLCAYHTLSQARTALFMPDDLVMQEPKLIYGGTIVPKDKIDDNSHLRYAIKSYLRILIPQIDELLEATAFESRLRDATAQRRKLAAAGIAYHVDIEAKLYALYKETYFNLRIILQTHNTPRITAVLSKFGVDERDIVDAIFGDDLLQPSTSYHGKLSALEKFKMKLKILNKRYPDRLTEHVAILLTCVHSLSLLLICGLYISGKIGGRSVRAALVSISCIVILTTLIAYLGKRISAHNDIACSALETSLAGRLIEQVISRHAIDWKGGFEPKL